MKKLLCLAVLASVFVGCKSIEVERRGHQVAFDGAGQVIKDAAGNPVILDLGWTVGYFQHGNWQRFDSLHARAGEAELGINGYASGTDSNVVALVSTSLAGVATITEKVAAAIVSSGGSVAADFGQQLIQQAAEKFVAKGGDPVTATVMCSDGSCTICDVNGVCETCEGCCEPTATK